MVASHGITGEDVDESQLNLYASANDIDKSPSFPNKKFLNKKLLSRI